MIKILDLMPTRLFEANLFRFTQHRCGRLTINTIDRRAKRLAAEHQKKRNPSLHRRRFVAASASLAVWCIVPKNLPIVPTKSSIDVE